jgi:hypothetical protein
MAICILYHLSIDNKSKPMFTFTNCVDKVNNLFFFKFEFSIQVYILCRNLKVDENDNRVSE